MKLILISASKTDIFQSGSTIMNYHASQPRLIDTAVATIRQSAEVLSTSEHLQLLAADQHEVSNLRHEIVWREGERPEFARNETRLAHLN